MLTDVNSQMQWRRGRDSNPRGLSPQPISSRCRLAASVPLQQINNGQVIAPLNDRLPIRKIQ